MSIATLTNIEKNFGRRVLFDKLNLTVYRGERIGLLGDNGSGKTTLLKVLTGQFMPDAGSASISESVKVGYLTQDPVFDMTNTVIDEAELAFAELHDLSHRMRDIEHEMEHLTGAELEKVLDKYQTVQHDFELAGGYAWRHKLEATLLGIGLDRNTWEQPVSTLSGGQKSRLALAKLLIAGPDMLLLDEPTNHLDLAAIEWLENYLLDFPGAVVLISHDRFLLDRIATRIVWLTRCKLFSYRGNYTAFVEQKELQDLTQLREYEEQQEDIEKQKEFIRRFGAGQRSKEAKGREKRLNRLLESEDLVQQVATQKQIKLALGTTQRAGDQVLQVRELSKAYDDKALWNEIGFHVKRGESLGIIGPNGSGKTTLLEVLLGRRESDHGNIKWGANLNIGYYDQKLGEFDPDATVYDEASRGRAAKDQQIREVLALMLFRGDDIHKHIRMLSGGERARVRLAQLLLDKPNVLVLDEPTNHLDIASREALENTLSMFDGTLLCVSHDRYFLDRVAQRLLVLEPPGLVDFDGNYTEWTKRLETQRQKAAEAAEAKQKPKPAPARQAPKAAAKSSKNTGNPYMRPFGRLSTEQVEEEITNTEIAIAECQEKLADPAIFRDPAKSKKTQAELDAMSKKLRQLEEEYYLRGEQG
jgi:ATP-binding cassette subfamily F protein 3